MKDRNNITQRIKYGNIPIFFMGMFLLLTGCEIGGGSDPEPNLATEILGFTFSPNDTVSVGDSLTIKVIVKDSLDTDLRFSWSIGIHGFFDSEKNSINFIVKEDQGTVFGIVRIKSTQPLKDPVEGKVQFEIKEN